MHINFGLFADILRELAATVGRIPKDDVMHRDQLANAVAELHTALTKVSCPHCLRDLSDETPINRGLASFEKRRSWRYSRGCGGGLMRRVGRYGQRSLGPFRVRTIG